MTPGVRRRAGGRAKALAEAALLPVARVVSRRRGRRGLSVVLAYHNVVPDDASPAGDLSLHLPVGAFRAHLDRLQRTHRVVPLDALSGDDADGGRPRAAITFDDAYGGALRLGLPELVERGLPATVFVPPGLLGTPGFWWDGMAPGGRGLDPGVRRRALTRDAGRPEGGARAAPEPHLAPASPGELDAALALPGIHAASHSWSHPNLRALGDAELREELGRPRRWLRERYPTRALDDHLSLPYGLGDDRVVRAAAEAGYRYVYRVDGGPLSRPPTGPGPLLLPRVSVPAGASPRGLELRLSGLLR